MWSHKIRYAMRALIALAEHGDTNTPVRELAEVHDIPRKYLETILGELRSAGLVSSTKGPFGGYVLALPPEQITVAMVIGVVDHDLYAALSGSADRESSDGARGYTGDETADRPLIRRVLEPIDRLLTETTIADGVAEWHRVRNVSDYVI